MVALRMGVQAKQKTTTMRLKSLAKQTSWMFTLWPHHERLLAHRPGVLKGKSSCSRIALGSYSHGHLITGTLQGLQKGLTQLAFPPAEKARTQPASCLLGASSFLNAIRNILETTSLWFWPFFVFVVVVVVVVTAFVSPAAPVVLVVLFTLSLLSCRSCCGCSCTCKKSRTRKQTNSKQDKTLSKEEKQTNGKIRKHQEPNTWNQHEKQRNWNTHNKYKTKQRNRKVDKQKKQRSRKTQRK